MGLFDLFKRKKEDEEEIKEGDSYSIKCSLLSNGENRLEEIIYIKLECNGKAIKEIIFRHYTLEKINKENIAFDEYSEEYFYNETELENYCDDIEDLYTRYDLICASLLMIKRIKKFPSNFDNIFVKLRGLGIYSSNNEITIEVNKIKFLSWCSTYSISLNGHKYKEERNETGDRADEGDSISFLRQISLAYPLTYFIIDRLSLDPILEFSVNPEELVMICRYHDSELGLSWILESFGEENKGSDCVYKCGPHEIKNKKNEIFEENLNDEFNLEDKEDLGQEINFDEFKGCDLYTKKQYDELKSDPSFHKIINGGITNSERFIEKINSKKVTSSESETTKKEPRLMVSPKGSSSLKKEKPELIADPIDADGFYDMGNRFRNEKKYQESLKAFSSAINLNPDISDYYNNRADIKVILGDFQGAIADCNKGIDRNTKQAILYVTRSEARQGLKDMNGACADMKKASSLGDKEASQWVEINCSDINTNDNDKSQVTNELQEIIEYDVGDIRTLYSLLEKNRDFLKIKLQVTEKIKGNFQTKENEVEAYSRASEDQDFKYDEDFPFGDNGSVVEGSFDPNLRVWYGTYYSRRWDWANVDLYLKELKKWIEQIEPAYKMALADPDKFKDSNPKDIISYDSWLTHFWEIYGSVSAKEAFVNISDENIENSVSDVKGNNITFDNYEEAGYLEDYEITYFKNKSLKIKIIKKIMFVVHGEHCTYGDDENHIEGDRFYINQEELTYDEDGDIEDREVLEGFVDEVFISDNNDNVIWEANYEDGKMTEFANGSWDLGEYKSLDDAIRYLKDEYIPKRLVERKKNTSQINDELLKQLDVEREKLEREGRYEELKKLQEIYDKLKKGERKTGSAVTREESSSVQAQQFLNREILANIESSHTKDELIKQQIKEDIKDWKEKLTKGLDIGYGLKPEDCTYEVTAVVRSFDDVKGLGLDIHIMPKDGPSYLNSDLLEGATYGLDSKTNELFEIQYSLLGWNYEPLIDEGVYHVGYGDSFEDTCRFLDEIKKYDYEDLDESEKNNFIFFNAIK